MKRNVRRTVLTKNRLVTVAVLLLIAIGAAIIGYPHFCQYRYKQETRAILQEYNARMAEYEEDTLEELYRLIVAYNQNLYVTKQENLVDAFSYQQVDFSLLEFGFDEEMVGCLQIPGMDIELPIYLGASKNNLDRGAGHLTQTSIPVGGVNTNAVLAAHRGMGTAPMFQDIEDLEIGDAVFVHNFRETLTYRVCEIAVILPTEVEKVLIQEGRDLLTLITCHPKRHNYQRYVVYCERVE